MSNNDNSFVDLTNERYRVLEAKTNKIDSKIDMLSTKTDGKFDTVSRDIYELKTEIKTDAANNTAATRSTIITAVGSIIAGLLSLVVVLILTA